MPLGDDELAFPGAATDNVYGAKIRICLYAVKIYANPRLLMSTDDHQHDGYHHGNLRRALLDATVELIRAKGVESLSLRAIARRAGVSHMAPYHHFADRAALVAAVAEEGFIALREAMLDRMRGMEDPGRQLQESGIGYVMFALKHGARFRMMFSAEVADKSAHPSLQAASVAAYAVLEEAITRCQQTGAAREGDPRVLSQTAWSLVHGLAMLLLDGHLGRSDCFAGAESLARAATNLLWEGLQAPPAAT